jgi:hypothetical protein
MGIFSVNNIELSFNALLFSVLIATCVGFIVAEDNGVNGTSGFRESHHRTIHTLFKTLQNTPTIEDGVQKDLETDSFSEYMILISTRMRPCCMW